MLKSRSWQKTVDGVWCIISYYPNVDQLQGGPLLVPNGVITPVDGLVICITVVISSLLSRVGFPYTSSTSISGMFHALNLGEP